MAGKNFTFDNIPDLSGKVALVTGANVGIGYITARELARKKAHVFVCARNIEKGQSAVATIKAETGNELVEFLQLDLLSLKNIKEAADKFMARGLGLHILINNAGIMATPFNLSADGIEAQFATNHIGHFLLLPALEKSAPSRIVVVSRYNVEDLAHRVFAPRKGIDFENINAKNLSIWTRYGQSKLANVLFANELDRRVKDKKIYVNSLHPGVVKSNLMQGLKLSWGSWVAAYTAIQNLFSLSTEDGALTQLYVATSPDIEINNFRGRHFMPIAKLGAMSAKAMDENLAKELWDYSEKIIKERVGSD
ncbi:631_t:CDS:2 [Paraglomus occultum]|uniref:631_t:CDS:1 n=1 Tax=Paraglomus occultum TaxID=144539 RepID=A0A9N9CTR8_9GLOM|nr:631_t:CDS:2 [Paraglomus occultum]